MVISIVRNDPTKSFVDFGIKVADGFFHPIGSGLEGSMDLLVVLGDRVGMGGRK